MLIKDKDITLYQLLSIKQDRVLYIKVLVSLTSRIWNLFIYLFFFFEKMGWSGDGKRLQLEILHSAIYNMSIGTETFHKW